MHLLAATPGATDDGELVDPGQTPADLGMISAADTELAALSQTRADMADAPDLRLVNLAHLRHPMVDLHLDACASRSRLVVARLLGGAEYWRYGTTEYAARLAEAGVPVAFLNGDDKPDGELRQLSTISDADYDALWSYLVEGGAANCAGFLRHAAAMLDGSEPPPAAAPLLRAGLYWPGGAASGPDSLPPHWTPGAPVVPLIFYRALVQGAGLHPVNQSTRALLRELTAPSANAAPVAEVVLSGQTEEVWAEGRSGRSARDIAMNVALPGVDGRLLSRAGRRKTISPSTSGCASTGAPARWCMRASMAIWNGCPARRWRCPRPAFPRRCSRRCRMAIRSPSTTPARAPRPSAAHRR